jgi:hypothetical protein
VSKLGYNLCAMALVEDDLPGVSKGGLLSTDSFVDLPRYFYLSVRSDFRVREDESLAQRLQEEECKCQCTGTHAGLQLVVMGGLGLGCV